MTQNPRKIIQVSAMAMTDNDNTSYPPTVIALADDGTVWESNYSHDKSRWGDWAPLPAIPQPK